MRRVPFIAQMEAAECGGASLAMVLAYYGHHAPLSEVRQACGISRDGSTAKNIVVAARTYGFVAKGVLLEPSDLAEIEGPTILHWEMNHFVVLERWTANRVTIVDPAVGRRILLPETFDSSFTGVAVELSPGEAFAQRPRARVSRARYIALLRTAGRALGMALFASLALDALATVLPLTTQLAIDHVIGRHRVDWLFLVAGSAAALATFSALWSLMRGWLLVRVRVGLDLAITQQFAAHLFELPIQFFAQRSTADLMMRVQANRTIRELLAGESIGLLGDGAMLLAYLGLMFMFDARLSCVVLGAGVAYVAVFFLARPFLQTGVDEAQTKTLTAGSALLQVLQGITTIKSAGVERTSLRKWLDAWIASLNANARTSLRQQAVSNVLGAIQASVPVIILYFGGRRVLDGGLTAGHLVGFQMLQAGFLGPLQGVIAALFRLQVVPLLLARMDDVLLSEREPTRELKCPRLSGELELEGVSFRYSPTGQPVLSDVSMRIEKGTKVALVGRSGSGKSTLARLLLGLYQPTAGSIRLDGHDLSKLDVGSVRRQYGVVLQETVLFDGTVADNLRLFTPNASMDHVIQAARVAQIHDDILALPRGYETLLSATGGALSGGQRQRLALARAIVHRPPIMILDEATSALDSITEAAIERYLSTRACTRIVIAHRLSTVRDADTIFVLDGGQIVERGQHDELIAARGLYAEIVAGERERPEEASLRPPDKQHISAAELSPFEAFRAWDPEELGELTAQLHRADFAAGARIVEQDARATGLFLIVEGTVAIELTEPGLAAWTVTELGAGALFGEIGLLDGSPSSASVVARTDARLLHLPYASFQDMLRGGDILAARAILALGAIVADRMRDAVRRYAELTSTAAKHDTNVHGEAESARRRRELPLSETLVGAPLDAADVDVLERAGAHVAFKAGQRVFAEGDSADTLFILLAGRVTLQRDDVGVIGSVAPGALLGETSAFDAGAHPTSAVAVDDVIALAIGRDALVPLLLSGQRIARKLLTPLAEALVRRFRLSNYRLREGVALERGEVERAHVAREQALEAAREERDALLVVAKGEVPVILVPEANRSGAACLAALLRASGRPVSLASVVDAFESGVGLPDVARLMGLTCRPLDVPLDELRALDAPILAVVDDGITIVVERYGLRGWRVMDPRHGRRTVEHAKLRSSLTGGCYEIRDESLVTGLGSLPKRVGEFALRRVRDLARLLLLTVVLQTFAVGASLATALAIERVFPFTDRPLLGTIVAASAALAISITAVRQIQARAIEHLRAHFDREILEQLMTHVLRLPIAFFDRFPAGEVLQRFQAFESVRQLFTAQGVAALLGVVSLLVGGTLLLVFDARLVVIPAGVLILYLVITWFLFRAAQRSAVLQVKARAKQQDRLIEVLQGILTLRMTGDRTAAQQRWLPPFLDELTTSLRQDRLCAVTVPGLEWLRGIALVLCVWLGARGVLAGALSLGALVAFLGALGMFLSATHDLSLQALASAPRLVDYGLVRATFSERREQDSSSLVSPGRLTGRITVDQLSFRYSDDGPFVLKDLSLEIESGMKIALVGASGSGKSTLGRLLLGLYLPTSGRILFDGKDVASMELEALRRRMGVVLQEPFLLTGSIRENIALGAETATLEKVVSAAKLAALHDDIEKMAMGYETLVAPGGTTFSGGQRQRVVIARALVSSPAVLLLDEATSALDNLSQALVERHLATSTATRIVIAHRLSTIVDADRIVVLQKGQIVEQGTHDELIARRSAYFDLVRAQL